MALGGAGAAGVVLARLAFPWPLRGMLELALPESERSAWLTESGFLQERPALWLAIGFVVIALLHGAASYVQRVSFARFAVGTIYDVRHATAVSLVNNARARDRERAGDRISRVVGDAARAKASLVGVLVHVAQNGVFFLGVAAMLALTDPLLGGVFLLGGLVAFAVAYGGAARISRTAKEHRRKEGRLADALLHGLRKSRSSLRLTDLGYRSGRADVRVTRLESVTTWAVDGVLAVTSAAVAAIGLARVSAGSLGPGDLFTVLAYLLIIHHPTVRLGRQTARLGKIIASAERLVRVGRLHESPPPPALSGSVTKESRRPQPH
jgi:ABC-type multidrug transport system fused ATPase/permease subunit